MSELPTILVTNGWKTDRNHKLTEVVIPSTVKTLQAPNKVTFMGAILNAVPSTVAALQELTLGATDIDGLKFNGYTSLVTLNFPNATVLTNITGNNSGSFYNCTALTTINAPNLETLNNNINRNNNYGGIFQGCTKLKSVSFPKLKTLNNNGNYYNDGAFGGLTSLTTFDAPELTSINCTNNDNNNSGIFNACTSLSTLNLPKLEIIDNAGGSYATNGVFYGCTALRTISLPSIQQLKSGNSGAFDYCTGLETVTLGSVGHPVTAIGTNTFNHCTQSGLTITIYTTGGASLSGEKWGATNATIVYETA